MKEKINFPVIFLTVAVILTGTFFSYISCLLTVLAVIFFFIRFRKHKIVFRWNPAAAAVWVIAFFYLFSVFWAVDKGAAIIGFIKFLPVGLFVLMLFQTQDLKENFFLILPYLAFIMTIIAGVLMQFDLAKGYFSVAGRLSGFFQYPNTYACFLLISELLLCSKIFSRKERRKILIPDLIVIAVLAAGMIFSGSRTVLVLAFLSNLILLLYLGNKKTRVITVIAACVLLAAAIAVLLIPHGAGIERSTGFTFAGSTLADRFLYYSDALPVILKHPFGSGYLGYHYLQGGFQTGVYSTMFVHNDFLQIFLDIGWIPGILLIIAVIRSLLSPHLSVSEKIILCTFSVHIFFDFDLQYVSMFMILILFLDYQDGKERTIEKTGAVLIKAFMILLGSGSLYLGLSLFMSAIHENKMAEQLYPWNTENQLELLSRANDPEEIASLSNGILVYNSSSIAALDSMAKSCFSEGDFGNVIKYENQALQLGRFKHDLYVDYMQMMVTGYQLYLNAGDSGSAEICRETLLDIYNSFLTQKDRLSDLGKMIKDQPDITLPYELTDAVKALQ